jgi:cytosine/adenosine deaminase-related metal-dependent hydrolase
MHWRRSAALGLAFGALAWGGLALAAPGPETKTAPPSILFRDVALVPMDAERVVLRQSVLVSGGRIVAIGKDLAAPTGAKIVQGRGRFLAPGLADMHVHAANGRDMQVLLAHGVTTVLDMGGASSAFVGQVVPAVHAGRRPGPHVYLALRVDGTPRYGHWAVATPEDARAVVRLAKTNHYDAIKVYNDLQPEVFAALVEAAREADLAVVGHGVTRVGLERQLAAGQLMVAHLEEYLYTVFFPADADPGLQAPPDSAIPAAVAMTKRAGAVVTVDLATYGAIAAQWGRPEVAAAYLKRPDVVWLDPIQRIAWRNGGYDRRQGSLDARLAFLGRFAKALADADVPLVAGTDAPTIPGLFLGASLRDTLYALRGAGFTNFQALSTATRGPGEMMGRVRPRDPCFGIIAVGCRADLLLLRRNPLEDLRALETVDGVVAGGAWRDAAELQGLLDGVARSYADAGASP